MKLYTSRVSCKVSEAFGHEIMNKSGLLQSEALGFTYFARDLICSGFQCELISSVFKNF